MDKRKKLALGTVQFGMQYGVSNTEGQVSLQEVVVISKLAASEGINLYDTAPAYGNSEVILGEIANPDSLVVTKTSSLVGGTIDASDIAYAEDVFQRSLKRLGREHVYGLLVHSIEDLKKEGSDVFYNWLMEKKKQGLVDKIGVSIYTDQDIDDVLKNYDVDIVQLPVSVLDQRLISSGHISRLKEYGIEIHARSIFLQGLLLMDPGSIPAYFDIYRNDLEKFYQRSCALNLTPLQLSLGFVLNLSEIDRVIIGVNTAEQFMQIIEASSSNISLDDCKKNFSNELDLLNPSKWVL